MSPPPWHDAHVQVVHNLQGAVLLRVMHAARRNGLLVFGLLLLAFAIVRYTMTARMRDRGTVTAGQITQISKRTLWVDVPVAGSGRTRSIRTRRPWYMLLSARRGTAVTIIYDPAGDYDRILFPARGRVKSWAAMWLGTVCIGFAGTVACLVYALARRFPRNIDATLTID